MKTPTKNSCGAALLDYLYARDLVSRHELNYAMGNRFVRATINIWIKELSDLGQVVETPAGLRLSVKARQYFEQCEPSDAPATITSTATSREAKPFRPLTGYKLNRDGMREGAGDFRNWKSRHLP